MSQRAASPRSEVNSNSASSINWWIANAAIAFDTLVNSATAEVQVKAGLAP